MGVSQYTGNESTDNISAPLVFFTELAAEHQSIMTSLNATLDEAMEVASSVS